MAWISCVGYVVGQIGELISWSAPGIAQLSFFFRGVRLGLLCWRARLCSYSTYITRCVHYLCTCMFVKRWTCCRQLVLLEPHATCVPVYVCSYLLSYTVYIIYCIYHILYISYTVYIIYCIYHILYISYTVYIIYCIYHIGTVISLVTRKYSSI